MKGLDILRAKYSIRDTDTVCLDLLKVFCKIYNPAGDQSTNRQVRVSKFCLKQFLMIKK